MAFPRPRICRTRLSTLMLVLVCGALIITLFNYVITSDKDKEEYSNDILDPRYLSKQRAYKQKLIEKFHLDDGGSGPSQMCKVPTLSLKTDVNQHAFYSMPPLDCGTNDLFIFDNYEIRINQTVLRKRNISKCSYKSIEWQDDRSFTYSDAVERKAPGPFGMKLKNEFFFVECYLERRENDKAEESNSIRDLEGEGNAAMRRLLQDRNNLREQFQDHKNPASYKEIEQIVQSQNLKDQSMKDIVKNIQNVNHPDERNFRKSHSHVGLVNHEQGGGEIKRKAPEHLLPIDSNLGAGSDPGTKRSSWMNQPRYMGSMGLPDSPLIDRHAQLVHQEWKGTGPNPVNDYPMGSLQNGLSNIKAPSAPQYERLAGQRLAAEGNINQGRAVHDIQGNKRLQGRQLDNQNSQDSANAYPVKTNPGRNSYGESKVSGNELNPQKGFQEEKLIPNRYYLAAENEDQTNGKVLNQKQQNPFKQQMQNHKNEAVDSAKIETPKGDDNLPQKKTSEENKGEDEEQVTDYPWQSRENSFNMYSDADFPDFEQFFAQIVPKMDVVNRSRALRTEKDKRLRMNVLIFAMDSMSHLSYQRKMPRTYKHIQREMDSVVLNGYNIVGDATTAAVIPLMTGRTEVELPEVRKNEPGSTFVDSYPLIWNKYEQDGYVTLFTEDKPDISVFNMRLNGFEEIPVDHYMRPFYQAVLDSNLKRSSSSYCTGGKPSHKYMLDYLKDFFHRYPEDIPKFAFAFLSDLSHDDNNPAQFADEDMVTFFKWMQDEGHLSNTVVIVMGDHGARYSKVRQTTQGKLEERLPMMSIAFPQWFQKKYPDAMSNFRVNADRLSTPFDIHATLKSILDPRTLSKPVLAKQRGISLLQAHPLNRTCASAGIDMHWCTCMNWQEVDTDNVRVITAANKLVENINGIIGHHDNMCSKLKLSQVVDAKIGLPNDKVLKFMKSSDADQRIANFSQELKSDVFYMQVIAETLPGRGLFEGTINIYEQGTAYKVAPEISRINLYGDQPHCIEAEFPDLRKYCYCRNPKLSTKPKPVHGLKQRNFHKNRRL